MAPQLVAKRCCICKAVKPVADFAVCRAHKDGLASRCRPCSATEYKRWRAQNVEKIQEANRTWKAANRDRVKVYMKRWWAEHPEAKAKQQGQVRAWMAEHREEQNAKIKARYWVDLEAQRARNRARHAKDPSRGHERNHVRKARMLAAYVEPVSFAMVRERDGGLCGICGLPVERSEESLDHVLPLAAGGTHESANVQLAHLLCNLRKGARVDYIHHEAA